jgi:acyl dehydratase
MSDAVVVEHVDERTLEEARQWVGRPLRLRPGQTEATTDNLRFFALGIGDPNPLYVDREYGRASVLGTNVAPPTFGYSIFFGGILPGLEHLTTVNAGAEWRFHDRLRLGDRGLRAEAHVADVELVTSSRGITRLLSTGLVRYLRRDAAGEETCFAELDALFWRMAPSGQGRGVSYEAREPAVWSDDELAALGEEVQAETRRGAETRYWDDVAAGDSLGSIVRGPYTLLDQVAYWVGERSKAPRAFEGWWLHLHDDPERQPNTITAMYTGRRRPLSEWGAAGSGHWDARGGHRTGMPGAYDDGHQRIGVVTALVTSWMGDAGFLRELRVRQRRPVIPGDLLRISGAVDEMLDEEPRAREVGPTRAVSVHFEATNQLEQLVTGGTAVVELPMRS